MSAAFRRQEERIEPHAGRRQGAWIGRISGLEIERARGEALGDTQLLTEEIELVAIVGAAISAEHHETAIFVQCIAEAETRLEGARECFALGAVGNELGDVVIGVDEVGIIGWRYGIDKGLRRDEIEIGRDFLVIPTNAEIERQAVGDVPVVLDIDPDLPCIGRDLVVTRTVLESELDAVGHVVVEEAAIGDELAVRRVEDRVVLVERIEIVQLRGAQFDLLVLDARLDRVAFEADPGEIVLDRVTLLAFVLKVGAAADPQDIVRPEHARPPVG